MSIKKRVALAVFLTAFTFGLNITGIVPVLADLSERYAEQGSSAMQMLQTLPYLLLMAGSLIVGRLALRIPEKRLLIAGLIVVGITGCLPFLLDGYGVLFFSRLLIGFGFGIISPLNTAVIAKHIPEEDRAGYLGLHVVGMGIGSMMGNLAGGFLAGIESRYFFLVYAAAFVSAAGVLFLLPKRGDAPSEQSADDASGAGSRGHVSGTAWLLSFYSFLHTVFITAYGTNIGLFIMQDLGGGSSITGAAAAVNAACAMAMGASFGLISKVFGRKMLPVSVLLAAAGFGSLLVLHGMPGVILGSALCGASLSSFMAECSYRISVAEKPEMVAGASGIFSVIGGLGGLISPIVLGAGTQILPGGNVPANQFILCVAGMALLLGIVLVTGRTKTVAAN